MIAVVSNAARSSVAIVARFWTLPDEKDGRRLARSSRFHGGIPCCGIPAQSRRATVTMRISPKPRGEARDPLTGYAAAGNKRVSC